MVGVEDTRTMSAHRFRELVLADEMLVAPDVFNALSATIAESVGFEALYLGGYATGISRGIAEPLLTMSEMRDHARAITQVTDVPLFVDGNAGFGGPDHVYRTVQEFARAGIAGMFVEDQVVPKRLGYHEGTIEVVDEERMVEKVRAAVRAREEIDDDIVLFARTDVFHKGRREIDTIEDAVDRVNTYLDAGADAAILYAANPEEAEYAVDHVEGPLKHSAAEYKDWNPSMETLEDIGFALTNTSNSTTAASALALREWYQDFHETGELNTLEGEDMAEIRAFIQETLDFSGV